MGSYLAEVDGYGDAPRLYKFNPNRKEVQRLYREGMSHKNIATKLGISRSQCYSFAPHAEATKLEIIHLFYLGHTVDKIMSTLSFEYDSRIIEALRLNDIDLVHGVVEAYRYGVPMKELPTGDLKYPNILRVLTHTRESFFKLVNIQHRELKVSILELNGSGVSNCSYISSKTGIPPTVVYNVLKENGKYSITTHDRTEKNQW